MTPTTSPRRAKRPGLTTTHPAPAKSPTGLPGIITMAVVGVILPGGKSGALCLDCWHALRNEPGLTFYSIVKGRRPCNVCFQRRKR